MRVRIVYAVAADGRNPDVDRMGTVEDLPDDEAQTMINEGCAVPADEDTAAEGGSDLSGKTKAELADLAAQRGVEVPASATKAELIAALGG